MPYADPEEHNRRCRERMRVNRKEQAFREKEVVDAREYSQKNPECVRKISAKYKAKRRVERNADPVRQMKGYLAIGVRDSRRAWVAYLEILKKVPKQGKKRVDAYYRLLAERRVALNKAFFDYRIKRQNYLYKKLKVGKWTTGKEVEKKWWAEKRPLGECEVSRPERSACSTRRSSCRLPASTSRRS